MSHTSGQEDSSSSSYPLALKTGILEYWPHRFYRSLQGNRFLKQADWKESPRLDQVAWIRVKNMLRREQRTHYKHALVTMGPEKGGRESGPIKGVLEL